MEGPEPGAGERVGDARRDRRSRLNTGMDQTITAIREKLRPIIDRIHARYDFEAVASVELHGLDPARPEDQFRIDVASAWAEFVEHRGRIRRHVDAAGHKVMWAFENALDAKDFRERFG